MPVGATKKVLIASLGLLSTGTAAAAIATLWKKEDLVAQCAQPSELPVSNFVHLYPGPPPGIPCDGAGPSACGRWEQSESHV